MNCIQNDKRKRFFDLKLSINLFTTDTDSGKSIASVNASVTVLAGYAENSLFKFPNTAEHDSACF